MVPMTPLHLVRLLAPGFGKGICGPATAANWLHTVRDDDNKASSLVDERVENVVI